MRRTSGLIQGVKDNLFISSYVVLCMLCCAFSGLPFIANFPFIMSDTNGSDRDTRTTWMRSSFGAGHESFQSLFKRMLLYRDFLMYVESLESIGMNILWCRGRGSGCQSTILSRRRQWCVEFSYRGARAIDGQAECLEDKILADVFGLEKWSARWMRSSFEVGYPVDSFYVTINDNKIYEPQTFFSMI